MKLNKFHLFLILLMALIFCCMGFSTTEGLSTERAESTNLNMKLGSKHDPFDNASGSVVNSDQASYKELMQSAVPASKMKSIDRNSIPQGKEDLYILKSQIVPPVCPKCPDVKKCDMKQDCEPCPAPQRCPNKPYECKMVPKYNDPNVSSHLPRPILNSFDSFA